MGSGSAAETNVEGGGTGFARFLRNYPRGYVLFRENEVSAETYVVQAGSVRISKMSRDVDMVLATLGEGEFFGEMATLNGHPRTATATIEEEAKLLVFDGRSFQAMIRTLPETADKLIRRLAARLAVANAQISNMLHQDSLSRVAHALAVLSGSGAPLEGGVGIFLSIGVEDLAARVGLRIAQVMRALAQLEEDGQIATVADGLVVAGREPLLEYVQAARAREPCDEVL